MGLGAITGGRRGGTELQKPRSFERRRRDVAVRRHELSGRDLRLAYFVYSRLVYQNTARVGPRLAAHRRRRYRERWFLLYLRDEWSEQRGREARGGATLEQWSHGCKKTIACSVGVRNLIARSRRESKTDRLQVLALLRQHVRLG